MHRLLVEVETTFGKYYNLQYGELETTLDFTHLSIRLIRPVFTTDTTQLAYVKRYPPVYFKADSLLVNGLNLRSLILGKNIQLNEILLANPRLLLLSRDSTRYDSTLKAPEKKRKMIHGIRVASLRIQDGDVSLLNAHKLSDTVYYGKNIDLTLTKANVPLQKAGPLLKNASIKTLVFAMEKVVIQPINSAYAFEMEHLLYDLVGDSIHGNALRLLPDRSLYRLSKQAEYIKTFAQIALGDVSLHGIDYEALELKKIKLRKLILQNARFFLLRNKSKGADPNEFKKSIRQALAGLPMAMQIDSLMLRDMQLEFQLYMPKKTTPAIIRLTKANGIITDLHNTSDTKLLTKLRLHSKIMANGKLDFQATFTPGKMEHSYKGQVYTMPFRDWDQVIEQVAPVKIESGTIDGIRFSGTAGDMETKGHMVFTYHSLKTSIWRTNKSGRVFKSNLLSGAANMIIKESNPAKGETEPEGYDYHFRREPWQGPVMIWVGGLLDGMEGTLLSAKNKERLTEVVEKRKKK